MYHEIIVIGGGASGIMAAITCRDMGKDVAIIETNNRIGKKILATGNGRCNISNKFIDSSRYHSNNNNFFNHTLESFTVDDTEEFFKSIGLPLITLEHGKMYPMSLQASSVVDMLKLALEDRNIPIYLDNKVTNIKNFNSKFEIKTSTNETFECGKLIIACGGKSSPKSGSDGSGFKLANSLGHNIIDPTPALVQIKLDFNYLKALSGVKFNGLAKLYVNNKSVHEEFGEILFTDYGISGPPILQLSSIVSRNQNKNMNIYVDIIPNLNEKKLKNFLENHWGTFSYRSVHESFIGILNKKIIPILLKCSGIENIHKPCYELSWKEKESIYTNLKQWKFKVIGTNSFSNAQVTAGGIDTTEVCYKTLESKKVKNLFFCGEILDVDGDCGGFNLQWAWASGYIASKSACK
ncbi:NAD(P)/FAD-dependent oxidoreductase [Clostridium niameyense]|uniref:NAD(P)/FAD-dependent oxidoreductase n=1 Tax=Clostridium niameyense TaxID=1622073 RepID=UPI00067E9227|nr:NAD(P)/FAD-dependent oxidoreductase [Clostridium niameyense]